MTVGNTDITERQRRVAAWPELQRTRGVHRLDAPSPVRTDPAAHGEYHLRHDRRVGARVLGGGEVRRDASRPNGNLPGKYFVFAFAPPGSTLQSVRHAGRNITDESIELTSADVTDLVATFIDKSSTLSGTVTDTKSAPVRAGGRHRLPVDSDGWTRGEVTRRVRRRPASKGGTFEFATLPAGVYHVVAVDNTTTAQWTDPAFLKLLVTGATNRRSWTATARPSHSGSSL